MTHDYYIRKAREEFARLNGDPEVTGPLAAWAEAHHHDETTFGVIVGEDGAILARTVRQGSTLKHIFISDADADRWGMDRDHRHLDVARTAIEHVTGQRTVHMTVTQLTRGAAARIRDVA